MDTMLDLLSGFHGSSILLGLQICFLGEIRRGLRIAFHSQVIEYQGIDITFDAGQ